MKSSVKPRFKVGDKVRIKRNCTEFSYGNYEHWGLTDKILTVERILSSGQFESNNGMVIYFADVRPLSKLEKALK